MNAEDKAPAGTVRSWYVSGVGMFRPSLLYAAVELPDEGPGRLGIVDVHFSRLADISQPVSGCQVGISTGKDGVFVGISDSQFREIITALGYHLQD